MQAQELVIPILAMEGQTGQHPGAERRQAAGADAGAGGGSGIQ